jgi:hypothetical protein
MADEFVPGLLIFRRARLPFHGGPFVGRDLLHQRKVFLEVVAEPLLHRLHIRMVQLEKDFIRTRRGHDMVYLRSFADARGFERALEFLGARLELLPQVDIRLG